ncbi:MAG: hypothetical protein M3301_01175, partial [Chloroflexota bacterium]|nr:hypothetical protein [Chloroflexota bacterium]
MVLRTPRRVSRLVLVLALAVPGVVLEQPAPVEAAVPVWQKYAPLVRFHPQERYWPAHATGFFIRFSELRYSVTRVFSWRIRGLGQIDPYRLGRKRWRQAYAWLG